MKVGYKKLWPTTVAFFETDQAECSQHNPVLEELVIADCVDLDPHKEHRVHRLDERDCPAIVWLMDKLRNAVSVYLNYAYECESIRLRGVAIKPMQCINTHTEMHESDLMVVYWPGGNPNDVDRPINQHADRNFAPTFLLEDPSRGLTDLRLPFESRHSISVCPRPGLLVIGPAHIPHNLWPHTRKLPFAHIVAQVKIAWPEEYMERF